MVSDNKKYGLSLLALTTFVMACTPDTDRQQTRQADLSETKSDSELMLHVPSPQWQDQIIYFLMTDRFSDGDPSNNDQGLGEYDPTKESHYSGGDLQGVINNLDYIQNLGATAVWTTPIVANQWWYTKGSYGGYHGYWATDFSDIDKHIGDLSTFKALSDKLHRRGMYLVQDIVVNHTGNFFNYEGGMQGYDPMDTAKNFILLESPDSAQPAPIQPPFDLIDRHNKDHVEADIYNWTPSISDYGDLSQQYTYQLATLADINTKNPVVLDRFKQIYRDWILNTGVDAFRIDTVRYVEHEFFHHFMHDDDGIHAAAKSTGRDHFLAFGEVFDTSKPYQNDAEHRVASYLGSKDKPELNSLISFPLHHELKTVFAQGFPTDHLAYRIQQHMEVYDNPYIIPTFIDNHDMGRFLASGDVAGFKQALATIMTIPGIPTIYQGSAQAMVESRQAMFKGGYMAEQDHFDQNAELYQFIAELARIRTSDKLFTRGTLEILGSNLNGAGLLAYKRMYQGRTVLIMFNTSRNDILVEGLKVSDQPGELTSIFGPNAKMALTTEGKLTTELKGRSIIIAEVTDIQLAADATPAKIKILTLEPKGPVTEDLLISGSSTLPNSKLKVVKNTRLDTASEVTTDDSGNWQFNYPVKNLGEELVSILLYHTETKTTSGQISFTTEVTTPQYEFEFDDPRNDDHGLSGKLLAPQHAQSKGQQDIVAVKVEIGGENLKLTLTMREFTDDWIPANGFDNVAFSIFFGLKDQTGVKSLPLLNAQMPNDNMWNLGHVVYGWGNTTFSTLGADAKHQGEKFGVAPSVKVDKLKKSISFTYKTSDFGISSWLHANVYITTWDITGEGAYRELEPNKSEWSFSGGHHNDAKILDEVTIKLTPNTAP